MRAASIEEDTEASFVMLASPASEAASRPKKMSKSFAIGRHASSRSGWRVTMSVRVWTRIQRFFTPLRTSAAASSRLLSGWFQKRSSAMNTASPTDARSSTTAPIERSRKERP